MLIAVFHLLPSLMWKRLKALCRSSIMKLFFSELNYFDLVLINQYMVGGLLLFITPQKKKSILLMWSWGLIVTLLQCFWDILLHRLLFRQWGWVDLVARWGSIQHEFCDTVIGLMSWQATSFGFTENLLEWAFWNGLFGMGSLSIYEVGNVQAVSHARRWPTCDFLVEPWDLWVIKMHSGKS